MTKKSISLLVFALVFSSLSGCSSRAWYEGFREVERQHCYEIESPSERQECLDKLTETSYDQYEKEREESKKD